MKDSLKIEQINAQEVLDSRGNPTVQVEVITEGRFLWYGIGSIWSINRCF